MSTAANPVLAFLAFFFIALTTALVMARRKGILHWLPRYLVWSLGSSRRTPHTHIIFALVDHYEPRWGGKRNMERERARVDRWLRDYPPIASKFRDSDGKTPQHTFFFPEEEYEYEHLNALESLCNKGFGEIEIHLHHNDDTSENLRETLLSFAQTLHREHGALSVDPETGQLRYAFIHGNWVLDNSHPKGRWCGVNDEITILKETGCYADFTFPCAPHSAQPREVNALYYAKDEPDLPKSHDRGALVSTEVQPSGDLMLITGPLRLNWSRRKAGIMPRIENSDLRSSNPPTAERVDHWVDTGIHVKGRPEWVFVKVHTHGAPELEADTLLGDPIAEMHRHLTSAYNDGRKYSLHYATAREMFNIIKAAEAGCTGNPNEYRDYLLPPPANTQPFHDPSATKRSAGNG
jgi:hypothetical protein